MKYLKFLLVGIFFGIVLVKSEAVSWYRIYEMFKFQSFHMYGIIGSAVFLGVLFIWLFKVFGVKNIEGKRTQGFNFFTIYPHFGHFGRLHDFSTERLQIFTPRW